VDPRSLVASTEKTTEDRTAIGVLRQPSRPKDGAESGLDPPVQVERVEGLEFTVQLRYGSSSDTLGAVEETLLGRTGLAVPASDQRQLDLLAGDD
jgi:hypothetical protein